MEEASESVFSPEEWGKIINRTRIRCGISVNELCKSANMSASTYTKFERGSM